MNNLTPKKSANFDIPSIEMLSLDDVLYSDEKAKHPKGEKYVLFYLDQTAYGILSTQVAEIFQPLSITPLFNVPEWMMGITDFRKEIISVIDLKKLWNKESLPSSPKSKLIVIRPENFDSPLAFAVDKVNKIVNLPDKEIKSLSKENTLHFSGTASYQLETLHLLDVEKILSALKI